LNADTQDNVGSGADKTVVVNLKVLSHLGDLRDLPFDEIDGVGGQVRRELLKDLLSTPRLEPTPRAKGKLGRLRHNMLAELIVVNGVGDLSLLNEDM
jgi:hypothetical protein